MNVVTTLLNDDATFSGLIAELVMFQDLTSEGITMARLPGAFVDGVLQPTCVVKTRSETPTYALVDEAAGMTSIQRVVELWFYDDRDAGWDTIRTARDRAYTLLQGQVLSTGHAMLINRLVDRRDEALLDACMLRDDYRLTGILEG